MLVLILSQLQTLYLAVIKSELKTIRLPAIHGRQFAIPAQIVLMTIIG
jgi:hypothetical protein